jgi:hypothetical protein
MYRGINELKRGHQPRSNLVKDENGDLLADSHNILSRWKYFSQLLNLHRVSDVRQKEIHKAELLVPDHSSFEVDIAVTKLKSCKSPGSAQILAELIHQVVKHYGLRSTSSLFVFGIRKNCLICGKSLLFYQFTRRAIKLTVVIIMGYHCCQLPLLRLSPYVEEITGDH